ncbi:MAG: hypothetical protein US20_C0026G0005 [Candidatus Pacebacteria bacterium GW2011_GWF1_36_5]|nr:MAG: hypothetical protein US20_C0026G0005 [Candidatus Pacebacteria bacterium GW2011_GWF1_36_5]
MSKLDQVHTRKATLAISTRADMRHLATLVAFWRKAGESPRSISELARLSLESFAEMLVTSHMVDFVDSQEAASELLATTGLMTQGVQRTNVLKALAKEGKINPNSLQTFLDPVEKVKLHSKGRKDAAVGNDSPELLQAQALLNERLLKELGGRIEDETSRTQGMFEALGEIPPIE